MKSQGINKLFFFKFYLEKKFKPLNQRIPIHSKFEEKSNLFDHWNDLKDPIISNQVIQKFYDLSNIIYLYAQFPQRLQFLKNELFFSITSGTPKKSWEKEMLNRLCDHYVQSAFKTQWARILASHPNEYGSFNANDIGTKARSIGLDRAKSLEEVSAIKEKIRLDKIAKMNKFSSIFKLCIYWSIFSKSDAFNSK